MNIDKKNDLTLWLAVIIDTLLISQWKWLRNVQ